MWIYILAAQHASLATGVFSSPALHRVMGQRIHAILPTAMCVEKLGVRTKRNMGFSVQKQGGGG